MARVSMSIIGASIEIEDDKATGLDLSREAMKRLKEANKIAIPAGAHSTTTGFHMERAISRPDNSYMTPEVRV